MATATATGDSYTVPLLIDGKEVTSSTTFEVISPRTHKLLWHASSATKENAIAAVDAAVKAFPSWSKTKPAFRRDIFLRAADILQKRAEECGNYMKDETGAADAFSSGFNIPLTAEILRDVGGKIAASLAGVIPSCAHDGTSALVLKEPFGVILGIAPWNAPYILGLRAVIYALAAGNTCVLKGPELSPRCYWAIGDVLKQAGLPDGALNVIYHRPQDAAEITSLLIEHPAIKKINFTGSTAVGSIISSQAGKHLKPVLMELGGKAPAIVLDDADVEKAAFQCALGAFLHSGQICMSTERIIVQKSILDKFVPALQAAIKKLHPEEGESPILVASVAVEKNKKLVGAALEKGAKLLHGDHTKDEHVPNTSEISKTRMRPVVVGGVTKDMDIYHTESFGPSVSVIEVDTEEEAIQIANDTDYGLSSAVFSENLQRALRIARQIETGAVHINSMSVHDEANLPHGGAKKSGWGRFNASWGLEEFLRTKTVTFQE